MDPDCNDADLPHNPGPRQVTPTKVRELQQTLARDRCATCRQLVRQVGLSNGTVHKVLCKELKLCKKPAKWIPHLLTPAEKLRRTTTSHAALALLRHRQHPVRVITRDESWFWVWQPESKAASHQWLHADDTRPDKVKIKQSTQKAMLVLFLTNMALCTGGGFPGGQGSMLKCICKS